MTTYAFRGLISCGVLRSDTHVAHIRISYRSEKAAHYGQPEAPENRSYGILVGFRGQGNHDPETEQGHIIGVPGGPVLMRPQFAAQLANNIDRFAEGDGIRFDSTPQLPSNPRLSEHSPCETRHYDPIREISAGF
jgi:hypothetical protein